MFSTDENRAPEVCESRGGRPGLPAPNSPHGLCGRKATLNPTKILRRKKKKKKKTRGKGGASSQGSPFLLHSFPLVHILSIVLAPRPNSESKAPFAENPETSVFFLLFKIGENTAFPCLVWCWEFCLPQLWYLPFESEFTQLHFPQPSWNAEQWCMLRTVNHTCELIHFVLPRPDLRSWLGVQYKAIN